MNTKPYKPTDEQPAIASEPEVAYLQTQTKVDWNPNVPVNATQEEWWAHIHQIEEGEFHPVNEVHQRIAQWLESKNKKLFSIRKIRDVRNIHL